ncbi:hypothetical protein [Streptomyces sp. NPDC004065]|uniref:hypothetical protein n=1 Tax=Streptomyces sp. NPDC004065 TaxID=3364689 RepID=UPI00384D5582
MKDLTTTVEDLTARPCLRRVRLPGTVGVGGWSPAGTGQRSGARRDGRAGCVRGALSLPSAEGTHDGPGGTPRLPD